MTPRQESSVKHTGENRDAPSATQGEASTRAPWSAGGVRLPCRPSEATDLDGENNKRAALFDTLIHERARFWTEVLSIPYIQDGWIETLRQVPLGKLLPHGTRFFGNEISRDTISQVIAESEPLLCQLAQAATPSIAKALRRKIASILVTVPMQPEDALALTRDVANKCGELSKRFLHMTEAGLRDCAADPIARDLERDLGCDAASAQATLSELLQARDRYLDVKNELFRLSAFLLNRHITRRGAKDGSGGDMLQEGSIGLLKAVERFDPRSGLAFPHHARLWMSAEIGNFLRTKCELVRFPANYKRAMRVGRHGVTAPENNRFLSFGEVAATLGVEPEVATALSRLVVPAERFGLGRRELPSQRYSTHDRDLIEGPQARKALAPLSALGAAESAEQLRKALTLLSPEAQAAISLRFGLADAEERTFREIGEALGCSEASAYRVVNSALRSLRRELQG